METGFVILLSVFAAGFIQPKSAFLMKSDEDNLKFLRELGARIHARNKVTDHQREARVYQRSEDCANPADIVFVLDESGSIYGPDFDKQLAFVNDVIDAFTVGPDDTHIGALTFASDTSIVMTLVDYMSDVHAMKTHVSSVTQRRGNTRTDLALRTMRNSLFSRHYARNSVVHIGIIITDGGSDSPDLTTMEAREVRNEGIIMFAIGVGRNVVDEELQRIATGPDYVFKIDNYAALEKLKEELAWKACHATTLPPPSPTTTAAPTTPPQMMQGCPRSRSMDILFGLPDEAGVVDTEQAIGFVSDMIDGFKIGGQWVQAGLTPRLCADSREITFAEYDTKESIQAAVSRRGLASTEFSLQLEYLLMRGYSTEGGGRTGVRRVAVLILDNAVADETRVRSYADDLRAEDIVLVVIAIGGRVDVSLVTSIAFRSDHAFFVSSYNDLPSLQQPVQDVICRGLGPEPMRSTLAPLPPVIEDCEATSPFDVIFSLPDEAGIRGTELSLDFVQTVLGRLRIAPDGVYAGLTPRRCQDLGGIHLTDYDQKDPLVARIGSRGLVSTALSAQLRYLVDIGFSQADGARPELPRFAVLVVDNVSADSDETLVQAEALQAAGVTVISIGVGEYVNSTELSQIAASDSHSFLVQDYSDLPRLADRLLGLLCQDIS